MKKLKQDLHLSLQWQPGSMQALQWQAPPKTADLMSQAQHEHKVYAVISKLLFSISESSRNLI
jgi:hypothetical protein